MHVLIVPDKFKGSLSSVEAAAAMAKGWAEGWAGGEPLRVVQLPAADGGEGTADALRHALRGDWASCPAHDALGREIVARYAVADWRGRRLAVIETSEANGLWRLQPEERDLLRANTFGVGELLSHALLQSGAEEVILGLGGSATNDGGAGLAAALGYGFLDEAGMTLPPWPVNLPQVRRIVPPDPAGPVARRLARGGIVAASDVRNPLLGERGATRVYGPQKGLRGDAERDHLERGLERLADAAAETLGADRRDVPGAGAAGGLGFGLLTFAGATMRPGFGLVAEMLDLEVAIAAADLVVTGEGSLDEQTMEGKTAAGVAALAHRHRKGVVAIAGRVHPGAREALAAHFQEVIALTDLEPGLSERQCMEGAADLVRRAAALASKRHPGAFSQAESAPTPPPINLDG